MKLVTRLSVLALVLAVSPALAQGADDARTYFEIGSKAYQASKYLEAAQAFEEAYKRSPRPGLLFSLGQAHRMEFFARSDPARLRDAVKHYTEYLAKDPNGKRAGEATEQLAKLKPMLEKLGSEAAAPAAPVGPTKPRVMISSPTSGVRVSFDGRAVSHPFIAEVEPGKHKVVLSAPGHDDYVRELVVDAKTGAPPIDVPLKEKPAYLVIQAPDGAEVSVDGRLQGVTPLPPLPVSSGQHFVAVTLNGHEPHSTKIALARGEKRKLRVALESTGQRTASWILLGVGASGVVAGGVLGFVAIQKQGDAESIYDKSESKGNLSTRDLARYDSLRQERDDFRLAAAISAGAGAALIGTGFMLRFFDQPKVPLPPADDKGGPKPETTPGTPTMEISAAPFWGPGGGGGSVLGRF